MKIWKRMLTFSLIIMIIIELIPLTSYAAEYLIYLEVEDIAPREGIQTDQTGYINVSYQFLSASKYNIGFSVCGADYQANTVEMT